MSEFGKAAAIVILTVILGTAVGKTEKDIATVLSVAACCILMVMAVQYLSEVNVFLWKLGNSVQNDTVFLEVLLRIVGISVLTELTCLICADSGNASLGKAMQILGNALILVQVLPVFEAFITLIQEILRLA